MNAEEIVICKNLQKRIGLHRIFKAMSQQANFLHIFHVQHFIPEAPGFLGG
jgi:hypothetical protein